MSENREKTVAGHLAPFFAGMLSRPPPVPIRFWDGSQIGSDSGQDAVFVRSARALRRIIFAPGELGFARAYVSGDMDIEGDIFEALRLADALSVGGASIRLRPRDWIRLIRAAAAVGAIGLPPAPPNEEVRLSGRLHSKRRDSAAISHHYDVSGDFYQLVLGPTLTYSCAYFCRPGMALDDAQAAKYDLICRKLGLSEDMRLLDVGCGWGGMVLHAAAEYGVSAVGVTLSRNQADAAAKRVAQAGLSHKVEIRMQDYRDIEDGPFDAISSIGMFEHVGSQRLQDYFGKISSLLGWGGRFLNHAISAIGEGGLAESPFIDRYVFPDGELHEPASVVAAMQTHGLEVRDLQSLREHYGQTLRIWVANLQNNWAEAVHLVGEARARVWLLYMAGSALGFEQAQMGLHQILGVKTDPGGRSFMPGTRPV